MTHRFIIDSTNPFGSTVHDEKNYLADFFADALRRYSLGAANGKLYVPTEDGDVIVVKLGEKYEVMATNSLPDQLFIASPVVIDGEIFLRSQNTLYCISDKK